MNITAKEIGRQLVITLGGAEDGMNEEDAAIANAGVRRVVVPPVNAEGGIRIWAYYAGILFGQTDESAETEAIRMTKVALGADPGDDPDSDQARAAEAQWERINALRWDEAQQVCQLALYWNSQGGGLDVVEGMLRDGHPKAQELLMTKNQVWNLYSRLRMLTPSPGSESGTATPSRAGSTGTSTPNGSSAPDARDAFGIRQPASEPSA